MTRYNVLPSIRALQTQLKSSSTSNASEVSQFTALQTCPAFHHSTSDRIRAGTILEPCSSSLSSSPAPSTASNRLRSLFANLPHSFQKHRSANNNSQNRSGKSSPPSNGYFDVQSYPYGDHFSLKLDSMGMFVPVHTQLPSMSSSSRSSDLPYSSSSTNHVQGLYTVDLLSQLTEQYPLITELIVSEGLEEHVPTTVGYPCRRVTLHRLVKNHSRIIAFDMKNYAFVEIDAANSVDIYALEQNDTLFQRYQAQLRWCEKHLSSFRSQIKTIVHSPNGTATFIQATPFHGQQLQPYHQRRNSASIITSPLNKHIPRTIFTSQESISASRTRVRTPQTSKFHTTSNQSKYEQKQNGNGKTTGTSAVPRKDVRVYFNDPTVQKRLQLKSTMKQSSFHRRDSPYRMNSAESDSLAGDDERDDAYQCTPL